LGQSDRNDEFPRNGKRRFGFSICASCFAKLRTGFQADVQPYFRQKRAALHAGDAS
jgi:hypothetical protein